MAAGEGVLQHLPHLLQHELGPGVGRGRAGPDPGAAPARGAGLATLRILLDPPPRPLQRLPGRHGGGGGAGGLGTALGHHLPLHTGPPGGLHSLTTRQILQSHCPADLCLVKRSAGYKECIALSSIFCFVCLLRHKCFISGRFSQEAPSSDQALVPDCPGPKGCNVVIDIILLHHRLGL